MTLKGVQLPAARGNFGLFAGKITSMRATAVDGKRYSWPIRNLAADPSKLFNLLA